MNSWISFKLKVSVTRLELPVLVLVVLDLGGSVCKATSMLQQGALLTSILGVSKAPSILAIKTAITKRQISPTIVWVNISKWLLIIKLIIYTLASLALKPRSTQFPKHSFYNTETGHEKTMISKVNMFP